MKSIIKMLAAVVLVGTMVSCAPSITVRSDYDRTANFSGYHTYAIAPMPGGNSDPVMGSQLMQKRITQALDAEMSARGYRRVEKNADLTVRFDTDARNLQQIQSNNLSPMWGWWWYGPNNNVSSRNYEENRVIISLLDTKTKEMVWQGWAKGELNARRKDRDELIRATVAKVMQEYPYRAGMTNAAVQGE
ncbi:DUF4136 domain-containing protein [Siphonobacter sp. BAB-5405]|uniref:DUF4136 domain-containing protein n=1 Tax=Siphonobacter sp. BAB-5405 TaxID=1864825 RepID=UPI001E5ADAAA|nr:DUF4136 domain-containing protein [Siphonobacter sp. BAB-5405]